MSVVCAQIDKHVACARRRGVALCHANRFTACRLRMFLPLRAVLHARGTRFALFGRNELMRRVSSRLQLVSRDRSWCGRLLERLPVLRRRLSSVRTDRPEIPHDDLFAGAVLLALLAPRRRPPRKVCSFRRSRWAEVSKRASCTPTDTEEDDDSTDAFLLDSARLYVSGSVTAQDQVHVQHRVRRRRPTT